MCSTTHLSPHSRTSASGQLIIRGYGLLGESTTMHDSFLSLPSYCIIDNSPVGIAQLDPILLPPCRHAQRMKKKREKKGGKVGRHGRAQRVNRAALGYSILVAEAARSD